MDPRLGSSRRALENQQVYSTQSEQPPERMPKGIGIAEMVLEIMRNQERFNPGRYLTSTEIAFRLYADKFEKELEIELEKLVLSRLEAKRIIKSSIDPEVGRKSYALAIPLAETYELKLEKVFSD